MRFSYAASLLLNRNILWVWLPTSLPFSKTFIWAGPNYYFQATIMLTSVFLHYCPCSKTPMPIGGLTDGTFDSVSAHFFCCFFGTLVLCQWRSLQPSTPQGRGALACFGFLDFCVPLCRCLLVLFSCPPRPVRFISFSWPFLRAPSQGRWPRNILLQTLWIGFSPLFRADHWTRLALLSVLGVVSTPCHLLVALRCMCLALRVWNRRHLLFVHGRFAHALCEV